MRPTSQGVGVRIGLFGGTFNPIHVGHLRAAVEVWETFDLDKVLLIPSANPPHKKGEGIASARDRYEMVRLAVQGIPFLEACDVELERSGPSYTIETLEYFRDHFGPECTIHFVVGQDAFSEIATWKSYRQLFSRAHFIVMTRRGGKLTDLEDFILNHISKRYQYDSTSAQYRHPDWCSIFCLDLTLLDVSATQTRNRIRHGRSVRFLVPLAVENFIQEKGLYQ